MALTRAEGVTSMVLNEVVASLPEDWAMWRAHWSKTASRHWANGGRCGCGDGQEAAKACSARSEREERVELRWAIWVCTEELCHAADDWRWCGAGRAQAWVSSGCSLMRRLRTALYSFCERGGGG